MTEPSTALTRCGGDVAGVPRRRTVQALRRIDDAASWCATLRDACLDVAPTAIPPAPARRSAL